MRRMPAEWERQTAVQLTWPHKGTDWEPMLDEITATYLQMAEVITRFERLIVVADSETRVGNLLREVLSERQMQRVTIVECPSDDTWARDHGMLSVYCDDGLHLLDFKFNGWGEKFESRQDNAISRRLYERGAVEGIYENHLDFVLEGGSVESDGRGTIFTTSQCLLAPHRNQPLTQMQIETELKRRLGAERVMWIDFGGVEGDDTDGHIDTMVRVAPNDTLLYIGGDKELEQQLSTFRTIDNRPYNLLQLPAPTRPCTTYANFLVVNDAVIYPTYGQPEIDTVAREVIGKAFPERQLIGLDCQTVIKQNGSLHCCTMQYFDI